MLIRLYLNDCDGGPVYHDDHGSDEAKAATEEEEIRTVRKHHWASPD